MKRLPGVYGGRGAGQVGTEDEELPPMFDLADALGPFLRADLVHRAAVTQPSTLPSASAGTIQLGGKWIGKWRCHRSRFLRKARSEVRAYPLWICKRRTTKPARKKIEQTRPSQLNRFGFSLLTHII